MTYIISLYLSVYLLLYCFSIRKILLWLLIDTRKESKNREESLNKTIEENKKSATDREDKLNKALTENQIILVENQWIISELTDKFNLVEDIKLDIKELKDKLL